MKCVRCDGSGLIEFTSGTYPSAYWMKGEMVPCEIVATEQRPVYRLCGCRKDKPPKPERESAAYA